MSSPLLEASTVQADEGVLVQTQKRRRRRRPAGSAVGFPEVASFTSSFTPNPTLSTTSTTNTTLVLLPPVPPYE